MTSNGSFILLVSALCGGCCCCFPAPPPREGAVAPSSDAPSPDEPPGSTTRPSSGAGPASTWRTWSDQDPMTDEIVVGAVLTADDGAGILSGPPTITVRCKKNDTDVMFDWHDGVVSEWIGTDLLATATLRFDDGKPEKISLGDSQGISTTYFSRSPITLAKKLLGHKKLLTGYTAAMGGKPVYTNFTLTGSEEALAPVRKACGW